MPNPIDETEIVLRHVPGSTYFQALGPRITSNNFLLRDGEIGVSVSRSTLTPPAALMTRLGNPNAGSLIAATTVEAIRQIGFDVVEAPTSEDAGHAEIREVIATFSSLADRKQLAKVFQFIAFAAQVP